MHRTRVPVVTIVAVVVTLVPSVLAFWSPDHLRVLWRDPALIGDGEWWRLCTSPFVQDSGVVGTIVNVAVLALLGTLAERWLGAVWLVGYVAGFVAGQAAGCAYGVVGAGASIGLAGLAGAMVSAAWSARRTSGGVGVGRVGRVGAVGGLEGRSGDGLEGRGVERRSGGGLEGAVGVAYLSMLGGTLIGEALFGDAAAVAGTVVGVWIGIALVAGTNRGKVPSWLGPAYALALAAGVVGLGDMHGPAMLAGLAVGFALPALGRTLRRRTKAYA